MNISRQDNRYPEIDFVKAVCIVTVVLIHALTYQFGEKSNSVVNFFQEWTRFAVPLFILVAGFLFNKSESVTNSRIFSKITKRIVPPYIVGTTMWILLSQTSYFSEWLNFEFTFEAVVYRYLFGTSATYYFVFVIFYLYVFALFLRKLPRKLFYILFGIEIVLFVWFYTQFPNFALPSNSQLFLKVLFRHPIIHLFPFMLGWLLSLHYQVIRGFVVENIRLVFWSALVIELSSIALFFQTKTNFSMMNLVVQEHILATFVLLMCFGIYWSPGKKLKSIILFLSINSYGIYLFHFPFVRIIQGHYLQNWNTAFPERVIVAWAGALLATCSLLIFSKMILRGHSKYVVGT